MAVIGEIAGFLLWRRYMADVEDYHFDRVGLSKWEGSAEEAVFTLILILTTTRHIFAYRSLSISKIS